MTPERALWDKAAQAIRTARRNAAEGDNEAAISRAYYAALHAASAALLSEGESPGSHRGVQHLFFERFVRPGRVSRSIATTLRVAERARLKADYDAFTVFDEAAAADLIQDVERFVAACAAATNPPTDPGA